MKEGEKVNYKKIFSNEKGFTLIEILLSVTILGIIMIGVMGFFTQAYSYTNMNQKKTAGINVARNALMHIERENFIFVRNKFENNSSEKPLLKICEDQYTILWSDIVEDSSCKPIRVNNVDYHVTIEATEKPEKDSQNYSFFVPLKTTVTWKINRKENSTVLEGVIKSEDIR